LLFGSWDSTGLTGGLGEKYTRCVVSELTGIHAEPATRAGTRVDPLNIAKDAKPADILKKNKDEVWSDLAKNRKMAKPSELNHGSVPWSGESNGSTHGGVTCDYIQLATTVSLPAIRNLSFGKEREADAKGHAVLAAMALHAATLNLEKGWHLRSRCDLVLDDDAALEWEILSNTGPETFKVDSKATRELLLSAIEEAKKAGLPWNEEPMRLTPSPALAALVKKSQELHSQSQVEED
jgi:CRISPR-associated protein Csb1